MMSASESGVGGYKEVIFMIKGKGVYSMMKFESGTHRVQRIPTTESGGRIPYFSCYGGCITGSG